MAGEPEAQGPSPTNEGSPSANAIESAAFTGDLVQARDVQGGIHLHVGDEQHLIRRVVPRQLPGEVRIFVNRDAELAALREMHAGAASSSGGAPIVLLITGSPGVGKTALALRWAHAVRNRFPDGDLFVNLRGYDHGQPLTPDAVLGRILRDLDVPANLLPDDLDARASLYRSVIAQRRLLVVLDNASSVSQVRPVIPGTPGSTVLVTSRSQLSGLVVRDSAQRIALPTFQESDSVDLLARVIESGARDYRPSDLPELARLCANLPLALRIAAERAVSRPATSLSDLVDDLRDDSALWDALSTEDEETGEAVRTVFAWSYRSLSDEAARMFRTVGLHPGPDFGLAVAAAAAGVPRKVARRHLDMLAGAFLVENTRPDRYQLHDLLRAYALGQARSLDPEPVRAACLDRMLAWYIRTADNASRLIAAGSRFRLPDPSGGPPEGLCPDFAHPAEAAQWFELEHENLVAAVRSADTHGLRHRAWQLAMVLGPVYAHLFAFDDWRETAEVAIAAAESAGDPDALASALGNRSQCAFRGGDLGQARDLQQRVLALRNEQGDERGVGESLNRLGLVELRARDLDAATRHFRGAIDVFIALGDRRWEAVGRSNLVESLLETGDTTAARPLLARLPQEFRELGEVALEGNALWLTAWALRLTGDTDSARSAIQQALELAEEAQNRVWQAFWLIEAARIHLAAGEPAEALACCHTAASLERIIGDDAREALALGCAGDALRALGDHTEASGFHLHASRVHRRLGDGWNTALALVGLADCQGRLGRHDDERVTLAEAASLLEGFDDPRAEAVRARVAEQLSSG